MNYAELVQEVVTLSGRPDMATTDIPLHVRAATLKMHQSDFYYKDLVEAQLVFATSEYIQQFETATAFARFRSLNYIRKYDPTGINPLTQQGTGSGQEFFKILTPDQILDSYSQEKVDVCYIAGTVVNVRSSTAFQYALAGWYQNPEVTSGSYASWIASEVPYAIVFEATANLFKAIGFDEQSASMRVLVADQLAMVKQIGISAEGR